MANYGQYTGYEPLPDIPGAFSFQTAGGKPVVAGGQAALDLKARLDAANAATQTAGGKAAGGFQISGMAGKIHDQATANNAADLATLGPGGSPPPGPGAPSGPPAAPSGPAPLMVNGINTGYVQGPNGQLMEHVAGTAGVSQKQLQKKATQGTELPTGASQSTSGGYDLNQGYLDEGKKNTEGQVGALNTARDAEITAQESGRAVAGDQFMAATAARDEQKLLADKLQAGVDAQQQVRDQALKEYTGTKVDPDRIFAGGAGFARRLGAALAAGFGAYGAAINHTENFAGKVVDNMIERDIHAQEVDLRTKKDASDSALGDLMRKGMTLDQAKNTLMVIQKDWARQQLELAKGSSGSDVINAKYDAQIGKIMQDRADADEKYTIDSHGKVTKAIQSSIMYPQAATAGGYRAVAPGKALGIAGSTAGVEGQVAGTASTIDKLGKGGAGGKAGTTKAQKMADIAAAEAQLAKFENTWAKAGKPGVLTTGYFGGDVSQELGAQLDALAPGLGRVAEGNAPNESTMAGIRSGMLSPDATKIESAINAQKAMLLDRKKSLAEGPDDMPDEEPKKE